MGNRANIKIIQYKNATPLYLYTHWNGSIWNIQLANALKFGESRWNDPEYLTRIIISRMYAGDVDDTTGGGIGVDTIPDNENPIIIVDIGTNTVYLEGSESDAETFREFTTREHPEMTPYAESIHDV